MRIVRVTDQILYNPDTGSYTVFAGANYIGSTSQRDVAERWAGTVAALLSRTYPEVTS